MFFSPCVRALACVALQIVSPPPPPLAHACTRSHTALVAKKRPPLAHQTTDPVCCFVLSGTTNTPRPCFSGKFHGLHSRAAQQACGHAHTHTHARACRMLPAGAAVKRNASVTQALAPRVPRPACTAERRYTQKQNAKAKAKRARQTRPPRRGTVRARARASSTTHQRSPRCCWQRMRRAAEP